MPKRLTQKKKRALIREEKASSKEYASYGFKKLAADEKRHSEFLKRRK